MGGAPVPNPVGPPVVDTPGGSGAGARTRTADAPRPPVLVAGGSVIGLACAWTAACAGHAVTIHQPGELPPVDGAAWVAGGMLGAYSEAWPGEEDALALGVAALRRWPDFVAALEADSPEIAQPTVTTSETILLAVDEADAADLATIERCLADHPGAVRRLTRRELRELEPSLARGARSALVCPEPAVDNRVLLRRLVAACRRRGVAVVDAAVASADALVDAARAEAGDVRIVVAAGLGARGLTGLPVRPVKGEVIRLAARPGCEPAPTRTIRARVHGRALYLVPRGDGLVVGATQYEHGDDREPTAGGVRTLLDDAGRVFPGIDEYAFTEVLAGLRPTLPDNLPAIGRLVADDPRVLVAGGHGRNGVLLTPLTAAAVLAELAGRPLPEVAAASPARLAPAAARRPPVTTGGDGHRARESDAMGDTGGPPAPQRGRVGT